MAWWEGFEETRLLIAADTTESGNDVGQLISLRHPKSGNKMCCLFVNGVLQELNWFKQSYTSWFLVDPVFIFLPIFEEARMKKGDDPGKFRLLDDIIFIEGYPGYDKLLSIAENCMQLVCEKKKKLDPPNFLGWMIPRFWLGCTTRKTVRVGLSQLEPEGKRRRPKWRQNHITSEMFIRASSRRKK